MSAVLQSTELRPMLADSLDEIQAIERDLYEFPWTPGNFRDSLAAGYDCREVRAGATLIGYVVVMLAIDEAHLLNLSIARPFQRRGHGSRLLAQMFGAARARRARSMILEVRPSNVGALALYSRHGFEEIGVRRGYYPAVHGREDAIVLSCPL